MIAAEKPMERLRPGDTCPEGRGGPFLARITWDNPTEFEIQAALYCDLQAAGFIVRGEFRAWRDNDKAHYKVSSVVADIAIFDNDRRWPYLLLELKRRPKIHPGEFDDQAQALAQTECCAYAALVCGLNEAKQFYDLAVKAGPHGLKDLIVYWHTHGELAPA